MKKRLLSALLALCLMLSLAPVGWASGNTDPDVGDGSGTTDPSTPTTTTPDPNQTSGISGDVAWTFTEHATGGTGTLTISGSGAMKDYTSNTELPWVHLKDKITEVVIGAGVTKIGNLAFSDLKNLETLYFLGTEDQWPSVWNETGNLLPNSGVTYGCTLTYRSSEANDTATGFSIVVQRDKAVILPNLTPSRPAGTVARDENDRATAKSTDNRVNFTFTVPLATTSDGTTVTFRDKGFRGWLIGDTVYSPNFSYTFTKDTTLLTQWDVENGGPFSINYHNVYNGKENFTDVELKYSYSEKEQLLFVTLNKPGYKFLGWTSPTNSEYREYITIPAGSDDSLRNYKANWQGLTYEITVLGPDKKPFGDKNTFNVSPESQEIALAVPTENGRLWTVKLTADQETDGIKIENATDAKEDSATLTIPADYRKNITLEGDWTNNSYDLLWDANGGNWGKDADGKDITTKLGIYTFSPDADQPVVAPNQDLEPPRGYEFDGWEEVTGVTYDAANQQIDIKAGTFGPLTLKAKWKETEYKVTWEGDGGTWKDQDGKDIGQQTSQYGITSEFIEQTQPTRDGYEFWSWKGTARKQEDNSPLPLESSDEDKERVLLTPAEMVLEDLTLTAQWKKIYTIHFDPGEGGTGEMPDRKDAYEEEKYSLPDNEFVAPAGKRFKTWSVGGVKLDFEVPDPDSPDPDNPVMKRNTYPIPSYNPDNGDEITFTAVWEDITYKVTYDADNATETAEAQTHVATVTANEKRHTLLDWDTPGCGFTPPAGKTFSHWVVAGQTREYQPGDSFPVTGDIAVKAVWVDESYTVTFVPSDPANPDITGTMASHPSFYGEEFTLPKCDFAYTPADPETAPKLEFLAWEVNGQGDYYPGAVITITGDTTVTAIWVDPANLPSYTVSYLPGGGSGEHEADTYLVRTAGTQITVPLPDSQGGFAFPDMDFAGWRVEPGNQDRAPGEAVTITGDVTATARWTGKIVYVQGGNVTGPDTYEYSDQAQHFDVIKETALPARPGYIFDKWVCDDPDVAIYGQEIDLPAGFSGTLTLEAVWLEDDGKYRVSFAPGEGTGTMETVTVDKAEEGDTTYTLPNSTFTPPTGKAFDGWMIEGDEAATVHPAGSAITLQGHVTLIAHWAEKTPDPDGEKFTVTFDPNGGTGEMTALEEVLNESWIDLPACTFTPPEGKEFDAWSLDGTAPCESRIFITGNTTVYALWKDKEPGPDDPDNPDKPDVWTITFSANGGTGTMAPVTVSKPESGSATYTLPACSFTAPEGKTFQAWRVGSQEYAAGAAISISGDTTVTAVWKDAEVKPPVPTSYTITYNLNGGYMTGSGPSRYNVSTEAQTLNVPVPYKSGFTFLGWTYSGVSKPTKTVIIRANMTGDLTVVANWQMNPSTGGVNGSPEQGNYIAVSTTAGGTLSVPYEYAAQGTSVTIQARPQAGFTVGTVRVRNSQGWDVGDLRDLGSGNYAFTMPNYRVNVSATFVQQGSSASSISRPVMNFTDVRMGMWFYDSVEYVYNRGMMSGVSATQFGPYGEATRGAIWTALAAHAGFDINGGATWYERGQYWAVNRGITDGASPSGTITREQLVTMLWRYKGSPAAYGGELSRFTDGYAVSPYAMDAMRWAVSTGLIGGSDGRLSPQASTTRAEAAAILTRFCQSM